MIIKIILALGAMFPFLSQAQSCNVRDVIPKVSLNIKSLFIDQSKNVYYLNSISKDDRQHSPIGMYKADKNIRILPSYTIKTSRLTNSSCAELNDVQVFIEVAPVIYLSLEAQQYQCTKNRVYVHEMNHYKIEMNALNELPSQLTAIARQKYNTIINGSTDREISRSVEIINKQVIDSAFELIKQQTLPYHEQLDTNENYRKESAYCSNIENYHLSRTIQGEGLGVLK